MSRHLRRPDITSALGCALEVVAAVAVTTAVVALLQTTAPVSGLEVLYIPPVLAIAIRRGQLAAFAAALLSVLTVNFLYIAPRHQLRIAHSEDLVELLVLMIAAGVVSRLAATARQRAAEAERRAEIAAAREREATILAEAASAILAGNSVGAGLAAIGHRIARVSNASSARVALESVPSPRTDELTQPLGTRTRPAWLYVSKDARLSPGDLQRLAQPLGRLIDVAVERGRVTAQAAEAEAARQAETLRTAVLHAISHDLRSPLTAITTAGSALRGEVSQAEQRDLLDVIDVEARRLAKLVDDLLDLSRIEAGAVAPQTDWCDLRDVVGSALAGLRTEHPIALTFPDELPLVRGDAAQLERVFSNLIENATKHSPDGTPVQVIAAAGAARVTVRVVDHGEGIPSAERGHVFEPFFRGRGRRGSGSGLGLAISRGFVEANGGRIGLLSGHDGGTSFAVSFPAVPSPQLTLAGPPRPARTE